MWKKGISNVGDHPSILSFLVLSFSDGVCLLAAQVEVE